MGMIPVGPWRVIHWEGVCEVVAGKDWAMMYISDSIHPFTALLAEAMPAGSINEFLEPRKHIMKVQAQTATCRRVVTSEH